MREIKFRAWDGASGQMFYFKLDSVPDWIKYANPELIMQYTGLKDKSGKEIYEGDIVQVFYHKSEQTEADKAYTVVIRDMMEDRFNGVGNGLGEVIGNIWENPELLTKSN